MNFSFKKKIWKSNRTALLILTLLSLVFVSPILKNINNLGAVDWDLHTTLESVPLKTIKDYKQFSLWNPYLCGGFPMLANPQSNIPSIFFLLILILGSVIGLKLQVLFLLVIGLIGMFFLSKKLGLSFPFNYLPPVIFLFSSKFTLYSTIGLTNNIYLAVFPWVLYFYLKSFENKINILFSGVFLTLMFFGGDIYHVSFTILFLGIYSVFDVIKRKNLEPIKIIALILVFFFFLGSIKILPMAKTYINQERIETTDEYTSWGRLFDSLLNRDQTIYSKHFLYKSSEKNKGKMWDWWEYGTYVGITPLILYLIGVFICWKKRWPLILTGLIFLLISLEELIPINLYDLIHKLPIFNSLYVSPRYLVLFIFSLATISSEALNELERKDFLKRTVSYFLIVFIILDLILVNSKIFSDAFPQAPFEVGEKEEFRQVRTGAPYNHSNSNMYLEFLQNKGIINCFPNTVPVNVFAKPTISSAYKGEYYFENTEGSLKTKYWSPNKIIVETEAKSNGKLVINQNYERGWKAIGANKKEVSPHNGLISTKVGPEDKSITFYYLPKSFIKGSIISLITIIIIFISLKKQNKNKK